MDELQLSKGLALDLFQVELSKQYTFNAPLVHLFTPGMYTRQILMTAKTDVDGVELNNWHISKIHKKTHVFCIQSGKAKVYNAAEQCIGIIEAPYTGITIVGSRRILQILEDMIWTCSFPLPYITGEENSWSPEMKEMLLMRIDSDLTEDHEINMEELQWHLQQ